MRKTISQRVMELAEKNGMFNCRVARRSFRGYTDEKLHNSIMRTARRLVHAGFLKSDNGNYTIVRRPR